jgi:hypothetical protein
MGHGQIEKGVLEGLATVTPDLPEGQTNTVFMDENGLMEVNCRPI